jgi:hypothetical protein
VTRSNRGRELAGRLSINPDEAPAPPPRPAAKPPAEPSAGENPPPAEPPAEPPAAAPSQKAPRRARASRTPAAPQVPATQGPGIVEGRMGYRSFYVADPAFARYRAAIYWLARNPQAAGQAPENMSVDIEDHMIAVAEDLERRFNDGQVFPAPPPSRRKRG